MTPFKKKERKNLLLIFAAALMLRMLLFAAAGPWQDHVANDIILAFDDAPSFHYVSTLLAENKPVIAVFNKQLYQYLIAFFYYIFGPRPFVVILFQILIGSVTCVFMYLIGREFLNEKIALFAGLFLAFEPSTILYSNHLLSETLFTFLFTVHVYFLVKFFREKKWGQLLYSTVFLGLSTNAKPLGLYVPVFLLFPFFLHFKNSVRKGAMSYLVLIMVFSLTVTPWMARNYIVAGKFAFSHDTGGKTLIWFFPNLMNIFKPPHTMIHKRSAEEKQRLVEEAGKPGMSIAEVVRKYDVSALELTRWQNELKDGTLSNDSFPSERDMKRGHMNTELQPRDVPLKKRIINAAWADAKSIALRTVHYFTTLNSSAYPEILGLPVNRMSSDNWNRGFPDIIKAAFQQKSKTEWFFIFLNITVLFYLYSTASYGIFTAIKKKEFSQIVLFVTIIVYFSIASIGAFSEGQNPRYRITIIPCMIILSCYGLKEIMQRFKKLPQTT